MYEFFLSLLAGLFAAGVSLVLVFGAYILGRWLIPHDGTSDRTNDLAGTVAFRIAGLHGLILALVYAQELVAYRDLEKMVTEESVAVSDVFNDMARYGGPQVAVVQGALAQYLDVVVHQEWQALGRRDYLNGEAWGLWRKAYETLLDLTPATDKEHYLAGRMRDRATEIARLRTNRGEAARDRFPILFWAPALIGLVLLAAPFFVFRPTRPHLILIAIFALYSGVVLFFIYAFSNPFSLPGRLEPAPFERLLGGDIGRALPPG